MKTVNKEKGVKLPVFFLPVALHSWRTELAGYVLQEVLAGEKVVRVVDEVLLVGKPE